VALVVFFVWVVSLVLLAIAAFLPRPWYPAGLLAAGLFATDLWLGLQFLVEATDPITF
jgi:hypothetical protein